ncbi:MAG: thrombospondin type 3 repeat-containing protein [Nannocystaceae bacterium]|nr:thrombospondin type 3 repeat-containing protein [Nannocystaceae bacterium]
MTITWSTLTRRALAASLFAVIPLTTAGCIEDSDCGICDPDNLILESISGVNYASRKIHLLGPECVGSDCPSDITSGTYFIEEIGKCVDTEEAKESPRGAAEFCKISPLVTVFGIEFVFNNLLDPTSVELVRKRPDNPQLFEVYDWKHQVLEIQGPITRYNGDYQKGGTDRPDQITRLVNLSCIDNLAADGVGFSNEDYEDPTTNPCNQLGADGNPRKMWMDGVMKSYGGIRTPSSNSCDTPQDGVDTCCSECDFLLSAHVAKYGLSQEVSEGSTLSDVSALKLNPILVLAGVVGDDVVDPNDYVRPDGGAIVCNPDTSVGDKYIECADFIPWVSRELEERTYRYGFCDPQDPACTPQEYNLPYYDQLRETHPSERPANLERKTASCTTSSQCRSVDTGHGLPGTECVGHIEGTETACTPGVTDDCIEGACVAEWFVTCRQQPDTTGVTGFCFDKRFSDRGAAACLIADNNFDVVCDEDGEDCRTASGGVFEIAHCDHNDDGVLSSVECCQEGLGGGNGRSDDGGARCDPLFQAVTPVDSYERNSTLPESTRDCKCPPSGNFNDVADDAKCAAVFETGCFDNDGKLRAERAGQYAIKFIRRAGGVIYDPAIKGFEFRPADSGSVPRASIESCAEGRGLIDDRNREDGWRANDVFITENFEDFDRALCSGQTYTVEFNGPAQGQQFIKDKADNTLDGKTTYRFETPEFHVVPGSGFPTNNLRIGACDEFAIRFSNKYDMSPENVRKIQIWRIKELDVTTAENFLPPNNSCPTVGPVAGGPGCATTVEEANADPCRPPCLTIDIANVGIGEISVQIDPAEFQSVLENKQFYRMTVAGLDKMASAAEINPDTNRPRYYDAFWDACGMPLILGETAEADFLYDFEIDDPKCKEDVDQDRIQLSCDNAPDFFNPFQEDSDGDGVGDVVDLCPTVPGAANNSADSDRDGVGNGCDNCRQTAAQYNKIGTENPPAYMDVRNIPFQLDTDQDGIGDVCDNCVRVANCQDYGPDNPYQVGDPIEYDDVTACNEDLSTDLVGDACEGDQSDIAAGPVGMGPDDDFDQDGIVNVRDACPRQPLPESIPCAGNEDCPEDSKCETADGICDHLDTDKDDVGNICDTCIAVPNTMQTMEGPMQEDDADGDFVGRGCETNNACENRADPRPFAFFEFAANGACCTVALVPAGDVDDVDANKLHPEDLINAITEQPLLDPDDRPLRVVCSEAQQDAGECRKLPDDVASTPGILTPPAGCEAALDGVNPIDNPRLTAESEGSLQGLWDKLCFLPQFDQDYDGFGDICDLCPFDFDNRNTPYVDGNGKVWPKAGAFCNGEYSIDTKCVDDDGMATGGSGGSDDGGSDDGSGDGGSGGSGG